MTTNTLNELQGKSGTYTENEKAAFTVLTGVGLLGAGEFGKTVLGTYLLDGMDKAVDIVLPLGNTEMRDEFPEPIVCDALTFVAEKLAVEQLGKGVADLSERERYQLTAFIVRNW